MHRLILLVFFFTHQAFCDNSDAPYFQDLRHYYQYDSSLPLQVQAEPNKSQGRTKSVTFRSHDGEMVYATITFPEHYDPIRKSPVYIGKPGLISTDFLQTQGFIVADISMRVQGRAERPGLSNSDGATPFATVWARLNTVIDYRRLLDYLEMNYAIDSERIIAGGHSRFGRIMTILAANDSRVKAVIASATSADWLQSMKTTEHMGFKKTLTLPWYNDPFYRQITAPIDPLYFAHYVKVPVLVLHNQQDKIVKVEGAYKLKKALGERAKLITYPEAGHALTSPRVTQDVEHWLSAIIFAPSVK